MNLLMKLDRWLGILLLVVAVLGFIFKWFNNSNLLSAAVAGAVLLLISATADIDRPSKQRFRCLQMKSPVQFYTANDLFKIERMKRASNLSEKDYWLVFFILY